MPANTKWGRAGWGRSPASLRRQQTPPMFLHRRDDVAEAKTPAATWPATRDMDLEAHAESDNDWSYLERSA
jgi:hypothetical protein